MTFRYIRFSINNRKAYITLNRPEKRNAINYDVVSELKVAFTAAKDDEQVKIIILNSVGDAFCAGADLEYLQQLQTNTYEENLSDSNHLKELLEMIYTHPKVVIAQVEGHALAGGCGLATVCDFCFSVPDAKFGFTEVKIGFIPAIVMVFLLRKVGEGMAKQMLLTGNLFTAEKVQQMGIVNFIADKNEIAGTVEKFADELCLTASAQSLKTTKEMIAVVQSMNVSYALNYAAQMNAKARSNDDCKRGISAFLSKEKISW